MSRGPIHLQLRDEALRQDLYRCALATAAVAGGFVLIVALVMLGCLLGEREILAAPKTIDQLKTQLAAEPSEQAKERIREADKRLREQWFGRRSFLVHGAWLLLGGGIVLAVSVKLAKDFAVAPYQPAGPAPHDTGLVPVMKLSLTTAAIVLAAAMLLTVAPPYRSLSFARLGTPSAPPVLPPAPRPALDQAWANFRGPGGLGLAVGNYPLNWDAAAGKNVLWKARVLLPGHGSPIVYGGRLFVAGGTAERREIYCFDADRGTLLWTAAAGSGDAGLKLADDTGWAPATPATDGSRVFSIFPTGDLVCVNLEGRPVWRKSLVLPKNLYGHTASLLSHEGLLFVQFDQGDSPKEGRSSIIAFDCATGSQVWRMSRPVSASWSTPAIITAAGGAQLITIGNPWIIAYEPKTGAEIWRVGGMSGEIVPSPAFVNGTLYVTNEQSRLLAIRPDGHGDVTQTHRKRLDPDELPDIVSPVAFGDRVLLVGSSGGAAFFNPKSNKTVWQHDFDTGFQASPVVVGGRCYLTDKKGVTHVIEWGDTFKELAASPIGQEVTATPAFCGGRIFIRGKDDLFCIGNAEGAR